MIRFLVDQSTTSACFLAKQQPTWRQTGELTFIDREGFIVEIINKPDSLMGTRGHEIYLGPGFDHRLDWMEFWDMIKDRDCKRIYLPEID